jgi:manganese transport protein
MNFDFFKNIGPGVLITAAFIGPVTVTVCLTAGANYSHALLWVLLFATGSTIMLQWMSAKLGLISKQGLCHAIKTQITGRISGVFALSLVVLGILLGNMAYEAGNISGTLVGCKMVFAETVPDWIFTTGVYIFAFLLLYFSNFKQIERFFFIIVILMSLSFLIASIYVKPDITSLVKGSVIPSFPEGSMMTILGLVGTTVVPYNLFLHASMISQKWNDPKDLPLVRRDTVLAIVLGGLISAAILVTGAGNLGLKMTQVSDFTEVFAELYGKSGQIIFGLGIFAAGFTSTITAPLAAGLIVKEIYSAEDKKQNTYYRYMWILVLTSGYIFATLGHKPLEIIKLAQFANGLLLPLIAGFLIFVVNKKSLMGKYVNTTTENILAILVWLVALTLGVKSLWTLFV